MLAKDHTFYGIILRPFPKPTYHQLAQTVPHTPPAAMVVPWLGVKTSTLPFGKELSRTVGLLPTGKVTNDVGRELHENSNSFQMQFLLIVFSHK